jgi:hypothetical protein
MLDIRTLRTSFIAGIPNEPIAATACRWRSNPVRSASSTVRMVTGKAHHMNHTIRLWDRKSCSETARLELDGAAMAASLFAPTQSVRASLLIGTWLLASAMQQCRQEFGEQETRRKPTDSRISWSARNPNRPKVDNAYVSGSADDEIMRQRHRELNSLKFNSKHSRRAIAPLEVAGNPAAPMKEDDSWCRYPSRSVVAGVDRTRRALDDEINYLRRHRQRIILLGGSSQGREFISSPLRRQFIGIAERQRRQDLRNLGVLPIDHGSDSQLQ